MTVADTTLAVFTFFNSLRFLAYVPQIVKAAKNQSGAEAISFGTWALFLASHASAMAYAIENQGDWKLRPRHDPPDRGMEALAASQAQDRRRSIAQRERAPISAFQKCEARFVVRKM